MNFTRCLLFLVFLTSFSGSISGQSEKDLREAFSLIQEKIGEKDLNAFLDLWDPDAVLYLRNRLYPIDRKELGERQFRQFFDNFFASIYSAGFTKTEVNYRVIGETGMVWGASRFAVDARDGTGSDFDSRLTVIFVWVKDSWKVALWNGSPPPIGTSQ
jgi:ketosteroid isomerase-like protein